jgi:ankyrin repeat protein
VHTNLTAPESVDVTWPPLHDAVRRANWSGDLAPLRSKLQEGADLSLLANTHASRDTSILHTAALGRVDVAALLLAHGASEQMENVCGPGEEGRWAGHTPLQMAAKRGLRDVAYLLIEAGSAIDIFSASALGDLDRVIELIEKSPEALSARDSYRATPLHWAAEQDQIEIAEYLVQRGLAVSEPDAFSETALMVASVRQAAHSEMHRLGRRYGVSVSFYSLVELLSGHTVKAHIHTAAAVGDTAVLQDLLADDDSLATASNDHGTTPLHWAARNDHVEAARILLDHGADIDARDKIGCPPLFYAAYWGGHAQMTRFLCEWGADIGFENVWGKGLNAYDCGNCGVDFSRNQ